MLLIDKYAYHNRLRVIHPVEKMVLALGMLLICLITRSHLVNLSACLIAGVIVIRAGIPWKYYLRLLLLPMAFVIVGLFPILVNVASSATAVEGLIWHIQIGHWQWYVNDKSLLTGLDLVIISFGSVSCFYLLILTTPLVEVLYYLKKWKVSPLLIEMISITYRFIFSLLDTSRSIYNAQTSRVGYHSFREGINTLGQLIVALSIKSIHRASKLHDAVESRGGYEVFQMGDHDYSVSKVNCAGISCIFVLLLSLFWLTSGI